MVGFVSHAVNVLTADLFYLVCTGERFHFIIRSVLPRARENNFTKPKDKLEEEMGRKKEYRTQT